MYKNSPDFFKHNRKKIQTILIFIAKSTKQISKFFFAFYK